MNIQGLMFLENKGNAWKQTNIAMSRYLDYAIEPVGSAAVSISDMLFTQTSSNSILRLILGKPVNTIHTSSDVTCREG